MIELDAVLQNKARWAALRGDSLDVLKSLPDASVDAFVGDPPSGIDFMNKSWDCFRRAHNPADTGRANVFGRSSRTSPHSYGESERDNFIAFIHAVMAEALRALKPGGHVLMWALPRTSHWTATGIEDAGFEIRDRLHDFLTPDEQLVGFLDSLTDVQRDALVRVIEGQGNPVLLHLFSQGFPKNLDIAKAIDKAAGIAPIGELPPTLGMATGPNADQWNALHRQLVMPPPTTADAKKWAGWGTALRPAVEHWILARKPVDGPVYKNVCTHGTGALRLDACKHCGFDEKWPMHVVLQHAPGCGSVCVLACPSRVLDEQATGGDGNKDGPARFYHQSKASQSEKNFGCELLPVRSPEEMTGRKAGSAGLVMTHDDGRPKANAYAGTSGKARANHHPTVKSVALMRWLVRLITPPNGVVVDPFMGSGSTGVACMEEVLRFIGIDKDAEGDGTPLGYVPIARARLRRVSPDGGAPLMDRDPYHPELSHLLAVDAQAGYAARTESRMRAEALEGF